MMRSAVQGENMYSPVNNAVACWSTCARTSDLRADGRRADRRRCHWRQIIPSAMFIGIYSSRFETTLATSTCSSGPNTGGAEG